MYLFKNLIYALLILLLSCQTSISQKDIFALNQFELNANVGGSLVQFSHKNGLNPMKDQIAPLYGVRFQYNRKINRKFQINAALGLGAHAFTYALPVTASPNISTKREHFFNSFQEFYVGARYTIPLKNNFQIGLNLGGGVVNFIVDGVGIYGGYQNLDNGESIDLIRIEYFLNPKPVPFVEIGPQISRTLKNQNELSLKLSYVQSFGAIYRGDYQFFDNTSNGTLKNSGSNFRLTLGYTFTHDRRVQKIAEINEELNDYKAAKIEYKKNKRYIHPKSMFVSLTGGIGAVKSYAEDPNGFIRDSYGQSLATRLMIEKGLKKNFFVEGGYQFIEYNGSMKFRNPEGTSSGNDFFTHQLNLGAGYRVIGKQRNYHYFNLHGGLSIGWIPEKKGSISGGVNSSMSLGSNTNYYTMSFSYETEIVSSLLIAPYIGISKDFRLTERMFINLMYRYQHGLNKLSKRSIIYENNEQYTTPQTASNYMNGTEHTIQLGLKFKLGNNNGE
jgi:hypothetical protein